MQKKYTGIQMQLMKSMQFEKWIDFRFIILLCFAFLLQQLSFATLQNNFQFNFLNANILQHNYFEKSSVHHQDNALELYTEVIEEDEDELNDKQGVCKVFNYGIQSFDTAHYSNAIHILFLSLASANQHQVDLPFFILFHSWKSHLA